MQNLNYNAVNFRSIAGTPPSPVAINMTGQTRHLQSEREEAEKWLLDKFEKSRKSAEEYGFISEEEMDREFGLI
ncbi:MAG: hypothetical protein FWG90_03955 [Oscillospiraceae bacterium]|nr:hypothetical protein [Oscillospiraceae bacterium]